MSVDEPTRDTPVFYDDVAPMYVELTPDRYDGPVELAFLDLIGSVEGTRVLDVCCGHGRVTREIARRGARVTGLDVSTELLAVARAREESERLGIEYLTADVSADVTVPEAFEVVTCHYGLSDVDDLDGAARTVSRALVPRGVFVFSILHPCFPGWLPDVAPSWPPGQGYFAEGRWFARAAKSELRRRVGATHRTLSTYINTMNDHGLRLTAIAEPPPPAQWHEDQPDADIVPTFLVARCELD